jgi:hypothetical protein
VRAATGHPSEPIGFTVGDDGRLLVWDLETRALRYRHQISHKPVTAIVHHPERDEVALVVNDGVGQSEIVVVEWASGEILFSRLLESEPIHLSYSPAGSFLVFTLPTFQSLFFLTADRGSARAYLDDGFGIVNFTQMGRSERNIMTYVPASGEFIYWNLQSGEELQRVGTIPRMDHLTLVDPENRRALAASSGSDLVIVDNLTGEIRTRYPASPIYDIWFDSENDRILVLTENLGRRTVLTFTYSNGRLRRSSFRPSISADARFVEPLPGGDELIAGDSTGQVDLFSSVSGRRTPLGPRPVVPVYDVAFTAGRMHLSLGNRILSLVSDAFRTSSRRIEITTVRQTRTDLEGTDRASLVAVGADVFIWGDSENPGRINRLSPPSIQTEVYYEDPDENPAVDVRSTPAGPVVVHRDGRVIQFTDEVAVPRFTYAARGAQSADWSTQFGLVIAKTRANSFDSSVIRVDQLTGETVRVRSEAFLTTDIAFGDGSTLYGVGLFGSPGEPTTRLSRYSGADLERATVLVEFDGEDPFGRVFWDRETGILYTTVGYEGLLSVEGRTVTPRDATGQIARKIRSGGVYIAVVNADGSVTLWNRFTGEFLFDLYALENGEWIAMNENGSFFASDRSVEQYLDLVSERRTRLTLEDFRIDLPYRE